MKKIQVVVVAAIKLKNKYLLTKRYDPKNKLTHGKWQMPGGGLEFNEKIEKCLHREVMEEVGVRVKSLQMLPYVYERIGKKWHGVVITYLCKPTDNNPQIVLNKEGSEYQWCNFEKLNKLDLHFGTAGIVEFIEKYFSVGERILRQAQDSS